MLFKAPTPFHARNVSVNIRYISIWLITCCSLLIINHKVPSILYYYSILTSWNGVNFQGIIVILMPRSITLSFYRQQKYVREGFVRSAPKGFSNLVYKYCNISQYLFWPQYPALLVTILSRDTRIYCIVTLVLTFIQKKYLFYTLLPFWELKWWLKTLLCVVLIIYLIVVWNVIPSKCKICTCYAILSFGVCSYNLSLAIVRRDKHCASDLIWWYTYATHSPQCI